MGMQIYTNTSNTTSTHICRDTHVQTYRLVEADAQTDRYTLKHNTNFQSRTPNTSKNTLANTNTCIQTHENIDNIC